jgi:signal transduction histidine kinase
MQRIHPDDRQYVNTILGEVLKGYHQQIFEIEYRFCRDDNSYAFIHGRGILLTDEEGKPVRMIGAEQDVSKRKRLENELLEKELENKKAINQATVDSQEQERGEIGKELHDNVNQVLTTTKLYLELALANEDLVKELIKKSSKNITTVINEIRQLSRSLMDPSLGDLGIVDSINDLIENIKLSPKIHISIEIAEEIENLLNKTHKLTVFRIIQESLNNIIKHAAAKFVTIQISHQNGMAELIVADDGKGFFQDSIKKGAGLKNITNRVYLINGTFSIDTTPGKGCRIKISFPIK